MVLRKTSQTTSLLLSTLFILSASTIITQPFPSSIVSQQNQNFSIDLSDWFYPTNEATPPTYAINGKTLPSSTSIGTSATSASLNQFKAPLTPQGAIDFNLPFVGLSSPLTVYWGTSSDPSKVPELSQSYTIDSSVADVCYDVVAINSSAIAVDCSKIDSTSNVTSQNIIVYVGTDSKVIKTQASDYMVGADSKLERQITQSTFTTSSGTFQFVYRWQPCTSNNFEIFDATQGDLLNSTYQYDLEQIVGLSANLSSIVVMDGFIHVSDMKNHVIAGISAFANGTYDFAAESVFFSGSYTQQTFPFSFLRIDPAHLQTPIGFIPLLVGATNQMLYVINANYSLAGEQNNIIYEGQLLPKPVSDDSLNYRMRVSANFIVIQYPDSSVQVFLKKPAYQNFLYANFTFDYIEYDSTTEILYGISNANSQLQEIQLNRPVYEGSQNTLVSGINNFTVNDNQYQILYNEETDETANFGYWFDSGCYVGRYPYTTGQIDIDLSVTNVSSLAVIVDDIDNPLDTTTAKVSTVYNSSAFKGQTNRTFNIFQGLAIDMQFDADDNLYAFYQISQVDGEQVEFNYCAMGQQFNSTNLVNDFQCDPSPGHVEIDGNITQGALVTSKLLVPAGIITQEDPTKLTILTNQFQFAIVIEDVNCSKLAGSYSESSPYIYCLQTEKNTISYFDVIRTEEVQQSTITSSDLNLQQFAPIDIKTYEEYPTILFIKQADSIILVDMVKKGFTKLNFLTQININGFTEYDFTISGNTLVILSSSSSQFLTFDITNVRNPNMIGYSQLVSSLNITSSSIVSSGSPNFFIQTEQGVGVFSTNQPVIQSMIEILPGFALTDILSITKYGEIMDIIFYTGPNNTVNQVQVLHQPQILFSIDPNFVSQFQYEYHDMLSVYSDKHLDKFKIDFYIYYTNNSQINTQNYSLPVFNLSKELNYDIYNYSIPVKGIFEGPLNGEFLLAGNKSSHSGLFEMTPPAIIDKELFVLDLDNAIEIVAGYKSSNESLSYILFRNLTQREINFHIGVLEVQPKARLLNSSRIESTYLPIVLGFEVFEDMGYAAIMFLNGVSLRSFWESKTQSTSNLPVHSQKFYSIRSAKVEEEYHLLFVLTETSNTLLLQTFSIQTSSSGNGAFIGLRGSVPLGDSSNSIHSVNLYGYTDSDNSTCWKAFVSNYLGGFLVVDLKFVKNITDFGYNQDGVVVVQSFYQDLSSLPAFEHEPVEFSTKWAAVGVHECTFDANGTQCDLILVPEFGEIYFYSWEQGTSDQHIINTFYPYFNSTFTQGILVQDSMFTVVAQSLTGIDSVAIHYHFDFDASEDEALYNFGAQPQDFQSLIFTESAGLDSCYWSMNSTFLTNMSFTGTLDLSITASSARVVDSDYLYFFGWGPQSESYRSVNVTFIPIHSDPDLPGEGSSYWFLKIMGVLTLLGFIAAVAFICVFKKKARIDDEYSKADNEPFVLNTN